MSDDVKIYKLKHKIVLDGQDIERLEFQRPKGKHLKHLKPGASSIGDVLTLASKLSGQLPRLFDEMDAEDVLDVSEIIGNFLSPGQKTGQTLSE